MVFKITRVRYLSLRRREQHTFNDQAIQIVEQFAPNQSRFFTAFKAASAKFSALIQSMVYKPKKTVSNQDEVADRAWSAFNYQVKASLLNSRDDVRIAAEQVKEVFNHIKSPNRKAFFHAHSDQQTLIQELKSLPPETLELAHCTECLAQFEEAAAALAAASTDALKERPAKKVSDMKAAISECYQTWQSLARYLEMKVEEGDLPGAEEAAQRLNTLNNLLNSKIKARSKIKDKDSDKKKGDDDLLDDGSEPNLVTVAIAEANQSAATGTAVPTETEPASND